MIFEAYLDSKKIASDLFKQHEPKLYAQWETAFEQLHEQSFTAQKLYQINPIRRRFPKSMKA